MKGSRANKQKVLSAVSSLKRALGIANNPAHQDEVINGEQLLVYTPDAESAELLAEIFYRFARGKRAVVHPPKRPEDALVPKTVKTGAAEGSGYWAGMHIVSAELFAEGMEKAINTHISPDIRPKGRGH